MILIFDKPIEKTKHKPLIKSMDKVSTFITKHYKVWIVAFLILLIPAIYGNNHTKFIIILHSHFTVTSIKCGKQ